MYIIIAIMHIHLMIQYKYVSVTVLKGHNTQHSGHTSIKQIFQNEIMVEIYSKRPVRAIGKVLVMKFS